jgi:hypothetical protein
MEQVQHFQRLGFAAILALLGFDVVTHLGKFSLESNEARFGTE